MRLGGRSVGQLMLWIAIVFPLGILGTKLLNLNGWGTPAALSHPSSPEELHDTFVPRPNQPPIFTRGSGTR